MAIRKHFLFVALLGIALTAPHATFAQAAGNSGGFQSTIAPLITKLCVDCHGEEEPEGKLSLHNIQPDFSDGASLETWRMIAEQIRFGDMPPEDADQPTAGEKAKLLSWLRGEMLKTQEPGAVSDEKLLLPQFGNYVDHLTLFDQRRSHVTPAPPRIWRLRPSIYRTVMPRLGERISGLANSLNSLDGSDFKDYSAPYFLDEASTMQLLANAKLVVANQVAPHGKDKSVKELVKDLSLIHI